MILVCEFGFVAGLGVRFVDDGCDIGVEFVERFFIGVFKHRGRLVSFVVRRRATVGARVRPDFVFLAGEGGS